MVLAIHVSGLTNVYQGEKGYKITADFENIGGLKVRAKVTLNGVQVGRVTSIKLHEEKTSDGILFTARTTIAFNKKMDDIPTNIIINPNISNISLKNTGSILHVSFLFFLNFRIIFNFISFYSLTKLKLKMIL